MSSTLLPWGTRSSSLSEKDTSRIWREAGLRQAIYRHGPARPQASESQACSSGLLIAFFGQSHPEDHANICSTRADSCYSLLAKPTICVWCPEPLPWRILQLRLLKKVRSKSYGVCLSLGTDFPYILFYFLWVEVISAVACIWLARRDGDRSGVSSSAALLQQPQVLNFRREMWQQIKGYFSMLEDSTLHGWS